MFPLKRSALATWAGREPFSQAPALGFLFRACRRWLLVPALAASSTVFGQQPRLEIRQTGAETLSLGARLSAPPRLYTLRYATTPEALARNASVWASGISATDLVTIEVPRAEDSPRLFFQIREEELPASARAELSGPEADQNARVAGVGLVVLAGTLAGPATVGVVARDAEAAGTAGHVPGLDTDMTYEVLIGGQSTFSNALSLELPYDPARVNPDSPLEDAVVVGYWMPDERNWRSVPCQVDPATRTVRFTTTHLSTWGVRYLASGYKALRSTLSHARVIFDPADRPFDNVAKQYVAAQDYAQTIADAADAACEAYIRAGFKVPGEQWFIVVDSSIAVEAEWAGKSGDVYIPTNFEGVDELRYEIGHELFHAVQNLYYNVYSAGMRRWWHEACATYASHALFLGRSYPLRFPFSTQRSNYCDLPLSTIDERHEYATAEFLAFLFDKSGGRLDFKTHFDAMEGYGLSSTLRRLEDTVRTKTGDPLHRYYRLFADNYWLNRDGVLKGFNPLVNPDGTPAAVWIMPEEERSRDFSMALRGGYTAQLSWLRIDSSKKERRIEVRATSVTGKASVDVHVLKDFSGTSFPWPKATLAKNKDAVEVVAPAGYFLCLVGVNYDASAESSITGTIREVTTVELTGPMRGRFPYPSAEDPNTELRVDGSWRLSGDVREDVGSATNQWPEMVAALGGTDDFIELQVNSTMSATPAEKVIEYPEVDGHDVLQYRPRPLQVEITESVLAEVSGQTAADGQVLLRFRFLKNPDDANAHGRLVVSVKYGLEERDLAYRPSLGGWVYDSGWRGGDTVRPECRFEVTAE